MLAVSANVTWLGDFTQATTEATKSHKYILINFSGSDWCGPCIRERKEILENDISKIVTIQQEDNSHKE